MTKITPTFSAQARAGFRAGQSLRAIGRALGAAPMTVRTALLRQGETMRPRSWKSTPPKANG